MIFHTFWVWSCIASSDNFIINKWFLPFSNHVGSVMRHTVQVVRNRENHLFHNKCRFSGPHGPVRILTMRPLDHWLRLISMYSCALLFFYGTIPHSIDRPSLGSSLLAGVYILMGPSLTHSFYAPPPIPLTRVHSQSTLPQQITLTHTLPGIEPRKSTFVMKQVVSPISNHLGNVACHTAQVVRKR